MAAMAVVQLGFATSSFPSMADLTGSPEIGKMGGSMWLLLLVPRGCGLRENLKEDRRYVGVP